MATTIARPTITNDSGTAAAPNGDGTVYTAAFFASIFDNVDALFTGTTFVVSGVFTAEGIGVHTFSSSSNSATVNAILIRNGLTGSTRYAELEVGNDGSATAGVLRMTTSTFSATSVYTADAFHLVSSRSGGLTLATTHASGQITFAVAGATAGYWGTTGGLVSGTPTGGDKGAGTINATAVYDDNVLLTDWFFDLLYDGHVDPDDPYYRHQQVWGLADVETFTKTHRHLPWMPGRADFDSQRAIGNLVTKLWEGQEQQAAHLFGLHARLTALEAQHA